MRTFVRGLTCLIWLGLVFAPLTLVMMAHGFFRWVGIVLLSIQVIWLVGLLMQDLFEEEE